VPPGRHARGSRVRGCSRHVAKGYKCLPFIKAWVLGVTLVIAHFKRVRVRCLLRVLRLRDIDDVREREVEVAVARVMPRA
jgi:hypothetical protein